MDRIWPDGTASDQRWRPPGTTDTASPTSAATRAPRTHRRARPAFDSSVRRGRRDLTDGLGSVLQRADDVAGCLPSLVRVFGETAAHEVVERRRRQRLKRGNRGRFMTENSGPDAGRAVAVERAPSGQHLEHDRAEREQIAPRVHFGAFDLFGRHVADGAQDGAVLVSGRIVALEPSLPLRARQRGSRDQASSRAPVDSRLRSAGTSRGRNRAASRLPPSA